MTRDERVAALAAGTVFPEHGKYTTYGNYGCRCDPCVEARQLYRVGYDREVARRKRLRAA